MLRSTEFSPPIEKSEISIEVDLTLYFESVVGFSIGDQGLGFAQASAVSAMRANFLEFDKSLVEDIVASGDRGRGGYRCILAQIN